MLHRRCRPLALVVSAVLAGAALAEEPRDSRVVEYPAVFFSAAQPYSAFDMLSLLPGFTFAEADADVRGFAGSAGNVLIDGTRPATKHETLEALLRRVPATEVERIELLRPGARGVDMQGRTVLANIVRLRSEQTRGSVELASTWYERDLSAPRVAGELSSRSDARLLEFSAARYDAVDEESGIASQVRTSPRGVLLRDERYAEDKIDAVSELAANYERDLAAGTVRVNGAYRRERSRADIVEERLFPQPGSEFALERERQIESEVGLHYERTVAGMLQLELLGIHRSVREREMEQTVEADEASLFQLDTVASESIVRGLVRRSARRWTFDGRLEGALNTLDGRSELSEDGAAVELPSGTVRVQERRAELFASATWRIDARWTVEAGSRLESSKIQQSGDSDVSKSFLFLKPRALATFAPAPSTEWHVLLERRVGQLDFTDFITSASLSADTVTAGNPELEPERSWLFEIGWERRFLDSGALALAVRRERISALVDRVPVSGIEVLDGIGNIGSGAREELELSLDLPLQYGRTRIGRLKAAALWRSSRAQDPTTGQTRRISADAPFEGAVEFQHDLPQWSARWGVTLDLAEELREYRVEEVRTERFGASLGVFAQYSPAPAWDLRLQADNLTDRAVRRERRVHEGIRGTAPLAHIETRPLRIGPSITLGVRRTFD